ncbi:hypothetical protein CWI75_15710 [Kineobactrum sediminis]|uniref:Uncharacterized protein n=1 Tax=Kineobactrum sediminis TaxID=1905677 RepID=A0A2N5XZ97_9GAMM|nr:hypothetical protein [Kineobactrum sediminis]PLW81468.1 hypothetical protein CWI75_15710 [Kineobactrum sediminis]
MSTLDLIDERYPHKVSAEFNARKLAEETAATFVKEYGFHDEQVRVIAPGDSHLESKVEPEDRRIAGTLVRSHVVLGLAFLVAGLIIAWLLVTFGPPITRSNPIMTFIPFVLLLPMIGMLIAGAISLRPDHDLVVHQARTASEEGHWTVVVHCASHDEQNRAKDLLGDSVRTL